MTTTTRRFLGLLGAGVVTAVLTPTIASAQTKGVGIKNKVVFQMTTTTRRSGTSR